MRGTDVPEYTARRIERIVDGALRESGALGVLPTPLDAIRSCAGIEALEPIGALPAGERGPATRRDPGAARRGELGSVRGGRAAPPRAILGAVWFEARTMYVDERQPAPRRRFTEAHELVHALCPWHHAALREDTAHELFGPVRDAIEAEANAGAGMLLFQGSAFTERAAALPRSFETVRALAELHGASVHATLHHYARAHPSPVAMLLAGRFPLKGGGLPVWRGAESPAFARLHGPVERLLPGVLAPGSAMHELLEDARRTSTPPAAILSLAGGTRVRAEAHYNRHAFLVLLVPARVRPRALAPAPAEPADAPAPRFARA